jgi:hypothetical protein
MGVEVNFTNNFASAKSNVKTAGFEQMIKAVNEVRNETLLTLTGNRSGKVYTVNVGKVSSAQAQVVKTANSYQIKPSSISTGGKSQRVYTASAPGEAPASLTGALRQSVSADVDGEGSELVGRVGTKLDYGRELEFGVMNKAARPWLRPSFEKSQQKVTDILKEKWF